MSLILQPIRVATGFDEDGMLVLDEEQRLVAVLVRLSDNNEVAPGRWYVEAKFGVLEGLGHPTYADLDAALEGIAQHLASRR
ncbi:hypothetical protein [Microvirga yunnanensis]|uniref:hypothetical protein n=1 Tax=Microvirga yunnanensis TaxID=2953740 RepID=UPI0021C774C7|nr:hypothetical protein [Microvirga sp. HBU65207]